MTHLMEYFSSWKTLKKAVAWLLKVKHLLMFCMKKRQQLHLTFAQPDITKEQKTFSVEEQMKDFKRSVVQ